MEVQLESFKQLKAEAMKISTKVEWTPRTLGISPSDLDQIVIEISEMILDTKKNERLEEAKKKKLSDQINAKGPQIVLPKLSSPVDILQWVRN